MKLRMVKILKIEDAHCKSETDMIGAASGSNVRVSAIDQRCFRDSELL
jgi:hypothetical protein